VKSGAYDAFAGRVVLNEIALHEAKFHATVSTDKAFSFALEREFLAKLGSL
jgi:hypothetical protein